MALRGWLSRARLTAYPVGPPISLDELFGQADAGVQGRGRFDQARRGCLVREGPRLPARRNAAQGDFALQGAAEGEGDRLSALCRGQQGGAAIGTCRSTTGLKSGGRTSCLPQATDAGRASIASFGSSTSRRRTRASCWQPARSRTKDESIKEVVWRELTGLLKSEKPEDVKYGLTHLDEMSGGSYFELHDFDREEVLDAVRRLITHRNDDVARAAITVLGCRNPYLSHDYAPGWLATIGGGDIPGHGLWDPTKENLGGKLYWKQLAAVVDSDAPAATRALAVRALGRAEEPAIVPHDQAVDRATRSPAVRQGGDRADRRLSRGNRSGHPEKAGRRPRAAGAAGRGPGHRLWPVQAARGVLATLLKDADTRVVPRRRAEPALAAAGDEPANPGGQPRASAVSVAVCQRVGRGRSSAVCAAADRHRPQEARAGKLVGRADSLGRELGPPLPPRQEPVDREAQERRAGQGAGRAGVSGDWPIRRGPATTARRSRATCMPCTCSGD